MNKAQKLMILGGSSQYWQRVKSLFGSSLIGYWPLWETSGTVANDVSGNVRNGTYSGGVTLGSNLTPNHKTSVAFSGSGVVDLYPVLGSIFPVNEGTIILWVKRATWKLTEDNYFYNFRCDASNSIRAQLYNGRIYWYRKAAGTDKAKTIFSVETDAWVNLIFSWSVSGDYTRVHHNGVRVGADITGHSAWSGSGTAETTTLLGSLYNNGASGFNNGNMADVYLLNRPITDTEALTQYQFAHSQKTISIIGDSISIVGGYAFMIWPSSLQGRYNDGFTSVIYHSVSGAHIMPNAGNDMDTQTTAAANDNADIIIIELGTNDDNAGDMGALQAKYEENIAELKTSNPRATIYAMNILPRWTDTGGGTPVDKSNIRTAIAAACTSQGITCWDTFATPWVDAAETIDGCHPLEAGHVKIATQVLARL